MTEPTESPAARAAASPATSPVTSASPAAEGGTDEAVAQGGAYEVLSRRLGAQGQRLQAVADDLNARRLAEFGDSTLALLGRTRIRTENNGVGRDIVQVGGVQVGGVQVGGVQVGGGVQAGEALLFGFNVYIGLRSQTRVEDVFGLYRLVEEGGSYDLQPLPLAGSFLAEPAFVRDFEELYAYYKHARLLQLATQGEKLLAAFQIGERSSDVRVFRWALSAAGEASYLDARGERDLAPPAPFDFEWVRAGRELEVSGRFPHLNILDTLFVETSGGDLTIKVENNTETGEGIFSESVEDSTQSIDDATFEYARVGSLILLRVRPYREQAWRGLVYNTRSRRVVRLDAILQACVQLPEDHGILFPGGSYLQSGEYRAFDASMQGMEFRQMLRSPNGEDVLYVFYERESGRTALFVYNLIQRQLRAPIFAHGFARLLDGRMVLFQAESPEPTRVHPMQVWQTPFTSDEYAASRPPGSSFMGRLGNAELVRAVSDLYDLARELGAAEVSAGRYERLGAQTRRLHEQHPWFDDDHCGGLHTLLREITATGEAMLDEFSKVQSIRAQSEAAMTQARAAHHALLGRLQPESWTQIAEYTQALGEISALRGKVLTLRGERYIDTAAIDAMSAELQEAHSRIGAATGAFLSGEQALAPLAGRLDTLEAQAQAAGTARELAGGLQDMAALAADLDVLSELLSSLKVDDATGRTAVVEAISALYARLNGARARSEGRRKALGAGELVAQFAAQFGLFGQSVASALSLATTPERADEQLARLLVGLEELEGQFGEHEQFLSDLLSKREELLEVFSERRQALLDERGRRAQAVMDAGARILGGLTGRAARLGSPDELNAFFAGDPLILKLRELAGRLRDLQDAVKADDLEARLKAAQDAAVRALRDRSDLFEDGGAVIRLGPRWRFSVNTQPLDLTLLPREGGLAVQLTGTDYLQPLDHAGLSELRAFWPVTLESESPEVYRGEYLAGQLLQAAREGREGLSLDALEALLEPPEALTRRVRDFAAPRYREGYETGVHDHDAALILRALLPLSRAAGPLAHPPAVRALAVLTWASHAGQQAAWRDTLGHAHALRRLFGTADALGAAVQALGAEIANFLTAQHIGHTPQQTAQAAAYLADEMAHELTDELADERQASGRGEGGAVFGFTRAAAELVAALDARLDAAGMTGTFRQSLERLEGDLAARWTLAQQWLDALTRTPELARHARFVPEAAALKLFGAALPHEIRDVTLRADLGGLLGEHPRLQSGTLSLEIDDTLARLHTHRTQFVPAFGRYQTLRQEVIAQERERLRLSEYQARPLTSFVRNRLINDVYLPIIGDSLAKQMGSVGEGSRSDRMGLLMLISPPGYGKTTLMEYVAHRLGLVFMKVNGPALGHAVRSLDPAQAPDATSRQELEKLNLALEMGNNVMLYLDDIQHTHPEFLQKFISLTDGTRRIEGVWRGQSRTYDLRGRRFAVVMAGNPYTESGEVFRVPDMLANRADIYNLGDVLGGMEDAFALSYIENSLTSNPVLAPLATRDLNDLYLLVQRAQHQSRGESGGQSTGQDVSLNALSHAYSGAEVAEIVATLQRLMQVRDVLARVNAQYIASAAQADAYRSEPAFRLQGSYRNMTKLAEKVSPAMNDAELQQLISDHYQGEAQMLTGGAEENLLKLGELRGTLSPAEQARWEQIRADFRRRRAMGGDDADTGQRMVAQLADIASGLQHLGTLNSPEQTPPAPPTDALHDALPDALRASLGPLLADIASGLREARDPPENHPALSALPETLRATIEPLLEGLAVSAGRQEQVTAALLELVEVIRRRQSSVVRPVGAPGPVGRPEKGE
ncbi:DNA repair ATPase [Deinococcus koreensis]|uniref:DNA repair protein n=1 Tax=Deinococcus koreensis TaxID=2054903 RepID=A0A2K3UVI3_9DEIO|nr:DNA repair ATPase [Deinococcus koreensis]PNY80520.1 DNA repair protein [Deinococcus koreensis]